MTEQQQTENRDILQQDSQRIDLDTPLMMGDLKIESLEIRKPNVAALQGIKLSDLAQGDTFAICTVLPRVCTPNLTKAQIAQLDPADLAQIGGVFVLFLQPKSVRAEMLRQL